MALNALRIICIPIKKDTHLLTLPRAEALNHQVFMLNVLICFCRQSPQLLQTADKSYLFRLCFIILYCFPTLLLLNANKEYKKMKNRLD